MKLKKEERGSLYRNAEDFRWEFINRTLNYGMKWRPHFGMWCAFYPDPCDTVRWLVLLCENEFVHFGSNSRQKSRVVWRTPYPDGECLAELLEVILFNSKGGI